MIKTENRQKILPKEKEIHGLVSVIIPTFNRGKSIIDAIESVLSQDYKNVEVVVIDDHSSDDTVNIVNAKYVGDTRVKCEVSMANSRGANHARNYGLSIAEGEYCAFLDSDDILTEHSISERINVMKNYPEIDMVYGDVYMDNRLVRFDAIQNFNQNKYLMQELSLCCYIVILVRTSALREIYPLDLSLKAWQDDALVLALNKAGCKLYHCGKPCAQIRRLDESITTKHHNMYYSLPILIAKYKQDIIKETSYFRYLLWKLRVLLDYLHTKTEDAKNPASKIIFGFFTHCVSVICRVFFRHVYA